MFAPETGEESIDYDRLVLAPACEGDPARYCGLGQSSRVHTLRTVDDAIAIRGKVDSGVRRAVVLGAGFIGVEAAEGLAMNALETTLVELPRRCSLRWMLSRLRSLNLS